MLPSVLAPPRGKLVEPEVYCRNATVSRPTAGACHFSASPEETTSLASTSGLRSSNTSFHAALKTAAISDVVSTVLHSASLSRSRILGSACFIRPRCAGYVVTAIAPAYRQP